MVRWSPVVALAAWICSAAPGAVPPRYSGAPVAQVFTDRDIPGSPQTRAVCAHPNGLIYVGNTEGLVEFDGVSWQLIPGTRGLIVHNVLADESGRVWYSGTGEFGFLVANELGVLTAHPLHPRLPSPERDVGHVLRMAVHGGNAFFVTQGVRNTLVRADPRGHVHEIALPDGERPVNVFVLQDVVHVITSSGVFRLEQDTLQRDTSAAVLATLDVHSVWPRAAGGAWIVSAAGLRLWDGLAAPLVSSDVSLLLADDRVSCGAPVGDGTFALGTEKHGVLLVDAANGQVLAHYDDDGGFGAASSTVSAVTVDSAHGLWLSRFAGVTRIQMATPAALHSRADGGVRGRVQAFTFHHDRLHVATSQGVFVRDSTTGRFNLLPGALGDTWVLLPTDDGLLVGGPDLRLIRNDGAVDIIEPQRLLFRSAVRLRRDPDLLVTCTGPGFVRLYRRHEGKWRFEAAMPHVRASLFPLIEDDDGRIWATRNRLEIVRLDWREGVRLDARLERIGVPHGLPSLDHRPRWWIFPLDGSIEVTSWEGLWRHDRATDRFPAEDRIAGLDPRRWSRAFPLSDGSLWLANSHEADPAAIAQRTGPGQWQLQPLDYTGLEAIRPMEVRDDPANNTVWLGDLGLASIERHLRSHRAPPPAVRLRSIFNGENQTLWGGAGTPPLVPFSPEHRTLRFSFAAPSLQPNAHAIVKTEYRTRLDGLDRQWSAWTTNAARDYSSLPPGRFTFRMQARDTAGREGPEAVFAFTLLPPWWRTWWAFTGYIALGLAGIGSLVRLRTRTFRRRNERLEAIVTERTQTLFKQNQELARLHRLELDEKITARLAAEKSRLETLRYQLNPHFLFNSLTSIRSQIPPGLLRARDSIDRLADFCRRTLRDEGGDERVSLGEEFAMIQSYLDIERFRLGDLLGVTIELDPAAAPILLPRLLLLPLIENALKYGSATSSDRVELRLSARRESDALTIEIANTGRWVEQPASHNVSSLGIGHENLRERLNRYYPGAHEFTHHAADGWVRVILRLRRSALAKKRGVEP